MRNLKKILSLVLAMAMMLSVMVTGAGAAFKDADEFNPAFTEAAEVLTNLGVIKGYTDGSFQPKDSITRAETAAMIYRIATGDVAEDKVAIYAEYGDFTDVAAKAWYAGVIGFCSNAQFILGYGDGTFGPEKNVTGYQAIAMILRAVGYDQEGEFVGPNWTVNTAAMAQELGMLENVNANVLNQPATRELVAELIFQAMANVDTVTWTHARGYKETGETLGEKQFDLFKVENVVLANEYANLGADSADALDAGKTLIGTATYKLSTDLDVIGEKVRVWIADDTAVSTPVSLADTYDWSNLDDDELTKAQKDEWKDAKGADAATFYNYDKADSFPIFAKGVHVKAIDNNDDDVYDYVLAVKEDLATIKTIATDGEIVLNTVKSADDQVVYEGAEVGDVVLVVTFDGATYIEKADSINGIVSGYSTKGDIPTATIGGAAYAISALANTSALATFDSVRDTYMPGDDWNGKYYTYYQDCYGNIIAYEEAGENATEYGLILDYDVYKTGAFQGDLTWRPLDGINAGDVYVKFLTVAGEVETAKVDADFVKYFFRAENDDEDYANITEVMAGDVVSYNINEEGEFCIQYTYECEEGYVQTDAEKNLARVNGSNELYNVGDDLVVFYYADAYESELLGSLLPNIPVYGVLTGDEAIADLEARKDIHQMDVDPEVPNSNHTNKYDGNAYMFNIDGIINPFVDYCYVSDFTKFSEEQINNEYFRTYNAIDSTGTPIEVTTKWPMVISADAGDKVFAYYSVDVNGETINYLAAVADVLEGDIHQGNGGMELYVDNDQDGKLYKAPAVYADVTTAAGGTTEISAKYCTTALVVLEGDKAVAVFVTDDCDNTVDYVDVTIGTDAKHIKIGSEIELNGCYTWTVGGVAQAPIHKEAVVKVAADWEGKTVVFNAVNPCYTCIPHNDLRTSVITKIAEGTTGTVCAQNLTGYADLSVALNNMSSIVVGNTENVRIYLQNSALQVEYAIYTDTAAAAAGTDDDFVNGPVIPSSDLATGVLVLKVTANDGSGVSTGCAHDCIVDAVYVAIKL